MEAYQGEDLFTVLERLGGCMPNSRNAEGDYSGGVNMAKLEEHPDILRNFVLQLAVLILKSVGYPVEPYKELLPNVYCGVPMGGVVLAALLTEEMVARLVFPEKRVTAFATGDSGEESALEFNRHLIRADDRVAIVCDQFNEFSRVGDLIDLIERQSAKVVSIICLLNRSAGMTYQIVGPNIAFGLVDGEIPIIAIEYQPMPPPEEFTAHS
jgi:orotate phosphoribosyltransferase